MLTAVQYVTLDVTSLVQGWVTAPATNFGLALTSTAADVLLDSKENDETGHAASLDITITSMVQQEHRDDLRGYRGRQARQISVLTHPTKYAAANSAVVVVHRMTGLLNGLSISQKRADYTLSRPLWTKTQWVTFRNSFPPQLNLGPSSEPVSAFAASRLYLRVLRPAESTTVSSRWSFACPLGTRSL
jgi:hypothetical protein